MPDEQITPPPAATPPPVTSWETITSEASAAPAPEVPVVPAPAVAPTAPAETPTLEKTATPQLDAEPEAARESESQIEPETPPKKETKSEAKDEYVAEADDPSEIATLPTPAQKRWAKRQYRDAQIIRAFLDLDKDIEALGDDLFARSPSRYTEHVNDIIKRHFEDASKMLFGMPYQDAKAKLAAQPNGQPTPTTTPQTPSTLTLPTTAELDALTNEQIVQKFGEVQQTAQQQAKAEMEAVMTAKVAGLQSQLDAVTQKTTTHEQQARDVQVAQIGDDLRTSVVKVVDEVIHDSGLEVKSDDPPKIANLKRAASRMIKTEYESTFDSEEDNLKVIARVQEFAKRLERHNAFREEDNLKVRLRAACEKIKQTPEFQAIFDEIEAYAKPKATTRTGGPVVPAPGAPAGVAPKSPLNWDEAIQQAQAASS